MSFLADMVPYFRTELNALSYKEWDDAFNFENIPENIIDRAYHIEVGTLTGGAISMSDQEVNTTITIRVFLKGYRKPIDARDDAIVRGQAIVQAVLPAADRLTSDIKNVIFETMNIDPLDDSNDNSIIMSMEFTVQVNLNIETQ